MRRTPTFPAPTFSSWRPDAATPPCALTSPPSAVRGGVAGAWPRFSAAGPGRAGASAAAVAEAEAAAGEGAEGAEPAAAAGTRVRAFPAS